MSKILIPLVTLDQRMRAADIIENLYSTGHTRSMIAAKFGINKIYVSFAHGFHQQTSNASYLCPNKTIRKIIGEPHEMDT